MFVCAFGATKNYGKVMRQVVAFRKVPVKDTCSVFESFVKGTDKLFMNPHICNKDLSQADTEE